ncbi:hypothetical protein [Arthrobacter sp. UYCu712]|uniref:hypothetical protein n=1 Tax=Arthrobacter sp. UYCu712 TaxID=3156340 RepID=UPI0033983FE2
MFEGASRVFVVDEEPGRAGPATEIGAMAINFADTDPEEAIMDGTDGFGAGCDVVGAGCGR